MLVSFRQFVHLLSKGRSSRGAFVNKVERAAWRKLGESKGRTKPFPNGVEKTSYRPASKRSISVSQGVHVPSAGQRNSVGGTRDKHDQRVVLGWQIVPLRRGTAAAQCRTGARKGCIQRLNHWGGGRKVPSSQPHPIRLVPGGVFKNPSY